MERTENDTPERDSEVPSPLGTPDEAPRPVEEPTETQVDPGPAVEPGPDDAAPGASGAVAAPPPPGHASGGSPASSSPLASLPLPDGVVRTIDEKPELGVLGAFAGGVTLALVLKRLGG